MVPPPEIKPFSLSLSCSLSPSLSLLPLIHSIPASATQDSYAWPSTLPIAFQIWFPLLQFNCLRYGFFVPETVVGFYIIIHVHAGISDSFGSKKVRIYIVRLTTVFTTATHTTRSATAKRRQQKAKERSLFSFVEKRHTYSQRHTQHCVCDIFINLTLYTGPVAVRLEPHHNILLYKRREKHER